MSRSEKFTLAAAVVITALIVYVEISSSRKCRAKGGVLLKDAAGWFTCVSAKVIP